MGRYRSVTVDPFPSAPDAPSRSVHLKACGDLVGGDDDRWRASLFKELNSAKKEREGVQAVHDGEWVLRPRGFLVTFLPTVGGER